MNWHETHALIWPDHAVAFCLVGACRTPGWIRRAFFEKHCIDCHDADTHKGNLDLTALKPDFADAGTFARWVKVYDRIESGEMPPKKKPRPPPTESEGGSRAGCPMR